MFVRMAKKVIKVPVYVIKKIHLMVRAKLVSKGKNFSEWVRDKEVEELQKK